MAASAGRVLLIGKGTYDSSVTYSPLDWVRYEGKSYVCKAESTGNAPTNTSYWNLLAQDGQDGAEGQVSLQMLEETVGWTGKNKLPFPYYSSAGTSNGITWEVNNDGTVKATGTATADSTFIFYHDLDNIKGIPFDGMWINGCPSGGSTNKYFLRIALVSSPYTALGTDTGNGSSINSYSVGVDIFARIKGGTALPEGGIVFSPMIKLASVSDDTYEPYHDSVEDTLRDAEVTPNINLLDPQYLTLGMFTDVNFNRDSSTVYASARAYVKAGTYVISFDKNVNIVRKIKDGQYLQEGETNTRYSSITSTTDGWIGFSWRDSTSSSTNWDINSPVQIEKGSVPTQYQPYYVPLKDSKFDRAEQRVLGAKQWFDSSNPSNNLATVTDKGKFITISTTQAGTWNNTYWDVPINPNTDYLFTADVAVTSGVGAVIIRKTDNTTIANDNDITSSRKTEVRFNSGNNEKIRIVLFCAAGTSVLGNVTYRDALLTIASDTDRTWCSYAKTNKQLTDEKANNSAIAPVENGTTASQAYAQGSHFMRNGQFATAKTAIASGATLTENSNYTVGDVGSELTEKVEQTTSVLTISSNSDLTKLKEGVNAVKLTSGIVVGSYTLSNNNRGYIILDGSNFNGIITDFEASIIYFIAGDSLSQIKWAHRISVT